MTSKKRFILGDVPNEIQGFSKNYKKNNQNILPQNKSIQNAKVKLRCRWHRLLDRRIEALRRL
jgi:hypothetical protein